jgi:hypothetical protein
MAKQERKTLMPLNFDLTAVHKKLGDDDFELYTTHPEDYGKEEKRWHPVSDALIWCSLTCGFDRITDKNVLQVAARIATLEAKNGPSFVTATEKFGITVEDVFRHIGLSTNVTPQTKAEFERRFGPLRAPNFGRSAHSVIAEVCAAEEQAQAG